MLPTRLMSFGVATLASAIALGACIATESVLARLELLVFVPYVQNAGASAMISTFVFAKMWADRHYDIIKHRADTLKSRIFVAILIIATVNIIDIVTISLTSATDAIYNPACFEESGGWNCDQGNPQNKEANFARVFFQSPHILASLIPLIITGCCLAGIYWSRKRTIIWLDIPIVFGAFVVSSAIYGALSVIMMKIFDVKIPSIIEERIRQAGFPTDQDLLSRLYQVLRYPFDPISLTSCVAFCIGMLVYLFLRLQRDQEPN